MGERDAPCTVVSLGMSCQAAHQLTRLAATQPNTLSFVKGPFDWLICPPLSAAQWLDHDLCKFDPAEIVIKRDHAWWPAMEFWFWHGFFRKDRESRLLDIMATSEKELSKLAYQRDVFCKLALRDTVFVWANTQNNLLGDVYSSKSDDACLTAGKRDRLQRAVDGFFGETASILFVSRADRDAEGVADVHLPLEPSEWKGRDGDWDRLVLPRLFSFR